MSPTAEVEWIRLMCANKVLPMHTVSQRPFPDTVFRLDLSTVEVVVPPSTSLQFKAGPLQLALSLSFYDEVCPPVLTV